MTHQEFVQALQSEIPFIRNYSSRLCWDQEELDEISSRAAAVALRRREVYDGRSHIRNWLAGIIRNQTREMRRDYAKKAKLATMVPLPDPSDEDHGAPDLPDRCPTPPEMLDRQELITRVRVTLAKMRKDQAVLLRVCHMDWRPQFRFPSEGYRGTRGNLDRVVREAGVSYIAIVKRVAAARAAFKKMWLDDEGAGGGHSELVVADPCAGLVG